MFFVSLDQVLLLHGMSLRDHGGSAGIRSRDSLEAAVMQPQLVHHYEKADLHNLAAAYAFHLAESQAFVDGNKRTAISTALFFLEINGIDLTDFDSMQLYQPMIDIAAGNLDRHGLAEVLRRLIPAG